jgi:hypothetical protein
MLEYERRKFDVVILGYEGGAYIKLTGAKADLFTSVFNFYRALLAVANSAKDGEALYNDGKGKVQPLSEVVT